MLIVNNFWTGGDPCMKPFFIEFPALENPYMQNVGVVWGGHITAESPFVELANMSNRELKIKEGQHLGVCELIEDDNIKPIDLHVEEKLILDKNVNSIS